MHIHIYIYIFAFRCKHENIYIYIVISIYIYVQLYSRYIRECVYLYTNMFPEHLEVTRQSYLCLWDGDLSGNVPDGFSFCLGALFKQYLSSWRFGACFSIHVE